MVWGDGAEAIGEAGMFSKENLIALALALMVIFIIIAATGSSPQWIYQGF